MNVPTTQTIIDTHKELHNLRLEINGLKSEKENVLKDVFLVQEQFTYIESRKKELEDIISNLSEFIINLVVETKSSIESSYILIRESREVISEYLVQIKILNNKIEESKKQLQNIIIEGKLQHQKNVKEKEDMEVMRNDLNIYKKRLEKIISENNLDIKIL